MPPLTDEQKKRIGSAFSEKFPKPGPCPICQKVSWSVVAEGFAILPFQQEIERDADGIVKIGVTLARQTMPSVPVVCTTCGNTLLLNAYVLGLGDIIGPSVSDEKQKAEAKEAEAKKAAEVAGAAAEATRG